MSVAAMRILVIGTPSPNTARTLQQLADRGWGSHCVGALAEARKLLETFQFDVVLALETLSDGRGYDLSEASERQSGTLLVGVALSESLLWLAVVERGAKVLGSRAFNSNALERELEKLLAGAANEKAREIIRRASSRTDRPALQRAELPSSEKGAGVRRA